MACLSGFATAAFFSISTVVPFSRAVLPVASRIVGRVAKPKKDKIDLEIAKRSEASAQLSAFMENQNGDGSTGQEPSS